MTGDVIIGILGLMQRQHPLGSDLIMARWLDDHPAISRVIDALHQWVNDAPLQRKDLANHVAYIAFEVFCGKPILPQRRKLTSLWRKHSEQGRRSKRLIKQWRIQSKRLQTQLSDGTTPHRLDERQKEVEHYEQLIAREKTRIDAYATAQATQSTHCPKCRGTGVSQPGKTCHECGGHGRIAPDPNKIRQHLRALGVARVTEPVWRDELKPFFYHVSSRLHLEHDEAVRYLEERLVKEKQVV
ncbi:TIGR02642 family protein [Vibrio penaeicida]|uniref:TIGR02642 family protein n=1 Tax=Vibrio penaeicida TaxID=104609 RepID=UPI001CC3F20D|nr:TIGR02642 family protein [Vibrio penaeicida]